MTLTSKKVTRRSFVKGSVAVSTAAVLGGLFGGALTKTASATMPAIGTKPVNLFDHHCSLVHKSMSDKLTRIVADPNVSAADTSKALRTTFCPCCNTQINASFPAVPWAELGTELGKAYG